jgi:hypothetical protein
MYYLYIKYLKVHIFPKYRGETVVYEITFQPESKNKSSGGFLYLSKLLSIIFGFSFNSYFLVTGFKNRKFYKACWCFLIYSVIISVPAALRYSVKSGKSYRFKLPGAAE